jgi:hypothetical protein
VIAGGVATVPKASSQTPPPGNVIVSVEPSENVHVQVTDQVVEACAVYVAGDARRSIVSVPPLAATSLVSGVIVCSHGLPGLRHQYVTVPDGTNVSTHPDVVLGCHVTVAWMRSRRQQHQAHRQSHAR